MWGDFNRITSNTRSYIYTLLVIQYSQQNMVFCLYLLFTLCYIKYQIYDICKVVKPVYFYTILEVITHVTILYF